MCWQPFGRARFCPMPKLQSFSAFTQLMVETRGNPTKPAVDAFLAAGYGEQQVLGIVLAIACKTFSNYVNHLAGTPTDPAFAPYSMDWHIARRACPGGLQHAPVQQAPEEGIK